MNGASHFEAGNGHTVLVVEDESDTRQALRDLLRLKGYTVETAKDGFEALRVLNRPQPPCVVVLDLLMPSMNGWELTAELHKIERLSTIPIIIVSGMRETHMQGMPQVVAQIRKPVDVLRLYRVIERHC